MALSPTLDSSQSEMDSSPSPPVESEYADLEPHELWGEHKRPLQFLLHYAKLFGGHLGDSGPKSIYELNRCLRMVRENKDKVSVSELETMLRSTRTWQLFEHFAQDSLELISNFVELLKIYCKDNWVVQYCHYGVCHGVLIRTFTDFRSLLWISLFSTRNRIMIAGVINGSDERKLVFNKIRNRNAGAPDIARNVVAYGSVTMREAIQSHPRDHERIFSALFAATCREGEYVLLPGLGGFHEKDALWLLDELWEIRGTFVVFCAGISRMRPGCAVLFTAIWRHVQRHNSTILLRRLRNLLLGYALTVSDPEFEVVCSSVLEIEKGVPSTAIGNEELPPVDIKDVGCMIGAFKLYLESEKQAQPPGDMLCFPFAIVYHNALTTAPDQVPPLLTAVIECVWEALGKAHSGLAL